MNRPDVYDDSYEPDLYERQRRRTPASASPPGVGDEDLYGAEYPARPARPTRTTVTRTTTQRTRQQTAPPYRPASGQGQEQGQEQISPRQTARRLRSRTVQTHAGPAYPRGAGKQGAGSRRGGGPAAGRDERSIALSPPGYAAGFPSGTGQEQQRRAIGAAIIGRIGSLLLSLWHLHPLVPPLVITLISVLILVVLWPGGTTTEPVFWYGPAPTP